MAAHERNLSLTRAVLFSAILLVVGVMACPNSPFDSGDPKLELERMHPQPAPPPSAMPVPPESTDPGLPAPTDH